MRFKDKVVFITGGSRGIGQAIVRAFLKEGAVVVSTYKEHKESANKLLQEEEKLSEKIEFFPLDVADTQNVQQVVQTVVDKYGKIDILVNNAGVNKDSLLMFMKSEMWDEVIDVNLKGLFNCCKTILPHMISKKQGVIINISSVAAMMGVAGQTNYCASKAGIIGFTRALAKELAGKNIRVNAVLPGYIETDMVRKLPEHLREQYLEHILCKRFGTPEEVAKVVLFLASEDASYIYGQSIVADGGILV